MKAKILFKKGNYLFPDKNKKSFANQHHMHVYLNKQVYTDFLIYGHYLLV